jgi:uncharacterized delta-60 repeat protein
MPLWTNRYNGTGNNHDVGVALAVDGSGNVIVTGYSTGSASSYDYLTIKYSSAGGALWTNRYNGPGNDIDMPVAVATDTGNNVYVAGTSSGGVSSGWDYATIKYSSSGKPLWTNRYNGPASHEDQCTALAVDLNSNVVVTGYSAQSSGPYDLATVKYSTTGARLWANRYVGPVGGSGHVAADTNGNLFVCGCVDAGSSGWNYITIKYSSAGARLWTNFYNGPGNSSDCAVAVEVDPGGNVIVTGSSPSSNISPLDDDFATIKYSNAGVPLWTNRYQGPQNGDDSAQAIAVDASGNVVVAGFSYDSTGANPDYAVIKYSSAGVSIWTNRYNGPGNDYDLAHSLAVDPKGNVIVSGYSRRTSSSGSEDYATVAYSGAGTPIWTNWYNGPGNNWDQVNAVAVDGSGNVIVTGYSTGSASGWDYTTVKYAAAQPTPPVITNAVLSDTRLVFSGTGGNGGGIYYVLASTNAAAWPADWVAVATNTFSSQGNFSVTNQVNGARKAEFFRLRVP